MLHDFEQLSEQWFAFRAGKFSSSTVGDIMKKGRGGKPSTMRANAITRLALERLTGQKDGNGYSGGAMQRGTELEPEARAHYSFTNGVPVLEIGCVSHDMHPHAICSPDGLVGDDGLVEIKCPETMPRHYDALNGGEWIKKEYHWQVQHQLYVTGRKWCDLVSYDPRFKTSDSDTLAMATVRVFPEPEAQIMLQEQIDLANIEVERQLQTLKDLEAAA